MSRASRAARRADQSTASRPALWPWRQVVVVLLAAIALRVVYRALASGSPFLSVPVVDASMFDLWARALAEGREFMPGVYFKPPFYPWLLAAFYRVGMSMAGVQVLQMLAGAASALLTLAIGRLVFAPRAALVAALTVALLPILPFFETQLLAETLTTTLTLAALLLVLLHAAGGTKPRWWLVPAAGLLLGAATLGRPNLMLLAAVIVVWLWRLPERRGRRPAGVLLVAFLVAMSPATIHNLASGEFVPVSANMGANLVTGHRDGADGVSAIPVGVHWDDLQLRCRQAGKGSATASSRYLTGEALRWMAKHPARTLALLGKKLVVLVNAQGGRNNISPAWMAREEGVWLLARWWPGTWLVMPFALVGVVFVRRGGDGRRLLLWALAAQAVSVLPFFVTTRFRLPLLPLLALFAAAAVFRLLRKRRPLEIGVLVAAAVVVNVDWFDMGDERWLAADHFNLGLIHCRDYEGHRPDAALAEKHFRRALELDDTDVDANERFGGFFLDRAQRLQEEGIGLERRGNVEAAARVLGQAARLAGEAARYHGRAAELMPRSFRSWSNRGLALVVLADERAVASRLAKAAGDSVAAATAAEEARGFYEAAHEDFEASLRIDRGQPSVQACLRMLRQAEAELPLRGRP